MQQPPPPSLPPLPQLTDKFMKAYYYEFLDRFTPQHDMMHPEVSVGRQFQYDNEDKIFDANHMRNMSPEKREEWVRFYQDILDNNKMYKPFYPRQPSLIPHEDNCSDRPLLPVTASKLLGILLVTGLVEA